MDATPLIPPREVAKPESAWAKLRRKFRHGLLGKWCNDRLASLGIQIIPYYIMLETPGKDVEFKPEGDLADYVVEYLTVADLPAMEAISEVHVEESRRAWFAEGHTCLGMRFRGKLAAFTWARFDTLEKKLAATSRPLNSNEAYLFDANTSKEFRGQGIAPYLRSCLYRELGKQGRDRFYSVSETLNASSIKFKQRLGARFYQYAINFIIFKRLRWGWLLKQYPEN